MTDTDPIVFRNTMLDRNPTVRGHDRLAFTLCMAIALHAALILGISFSQSDLFNPSIPPRLEITLAQYQQAEKVEDADYLAQSNQQGSGSLADKAELTSAQISELNDTRIRQVGQPQQQLSTSPRQTAIREQLTTNERSSFRLYDQRLREELPDPQPQLTPTTAVATQHQDFSSLDAKYAEQENTATRSPRLSPRQVASTQSASFAAYQHRWQRHIEHIGNLYYPEEARKKHLYGDLVLRVVLDAEGNLQDLTIMQSSGHPVLDTAALNIVRGAAPFEPFSAEMRKDNDMLEIIYKWQFVK